ncbi:glycosyltransferase family 4 protein [Methanolobus sediminis]|uniref:Glycosyltransferase family 4 protein n=1 Tax=Methanolobus sediminis TaxID=3072978 RepID=A0AA51YIA4_9EURY|nr:glycosyltransferase family 4 protein [Methanolobus sediminis]WMW24310.1 glycosyltransferase family 4 protein [Methanolobus sediminis]
MSNKKKILLIPEFNSFGGTRSYFISLLEFYSSQDYNVTVILTKHQLDTEIKLLLKHYNYKYYNIPDRNGRFKKCLCYFPLNLFYDIPMIFPIYFKEKPSVIVVSNGTPGMFIGLILFPVKFIYIFHTYPLKSKIVGLSSIQKLFLSFFLNTNKILVTVSEYSKKQILSNWVPAKKSKHIHVIYNSTKTHVKNLNSVNTNVYRILTLGHVTWYKNPKLWIEVSQKVIRQRPKMDIEFIWAGEGDLLNQCQDLVNQIGLDTIKFIGYQENVDLLYQKSVIYFQPSLLENHSISVVEAMAYGLPCVTSNIGGLPESVVDGETGFTCPPHDVECFVSQIIKLLDDDKLICKVGQCGKLRAETLFSEEVQERKMIDLYSSLLNK